ncbi:MAG: transposase [Roseomonas sp.]|nr:transposase [Roseomonas sp.]
MEVVTRGERRRRWTEEDRARILTEAMAPGAIASHVARRFVVSTGQFYTWRKAMLSRATPLGGKSEFAKADFAEVRLSAPDPLPAPALPISPTGVMEIALPGGALIRVDTAVDGAALGRVLAALTGR